MRPPDAEILAIRQTAGLSRLSDVGLLRVSGPGAFDLLDRACTSRIYIRENEMLQTLLLQPDGSVFADAFICQDEDSIFLIAEGPSTADLVAHLERARTERAQSAAVELENLGKDHVLFGIDGPFAWELCADVLGPEILGAPYLSFVKLGALVCCRAGKTGEYGYQVIVPAADAPALEAKLQERALAQGAASVGRAALDQCALENWHFAMRFVQSATGKALTPLELQLQWRIDASKEFIGSDALRALRQRGLQSRVTCFTSKAEVAAEQPVFLDAHRIGTVLAAGHSCTRQETVGWALLDIALAWPGIQGLQVQTGAGRVAIQTRSAPLLNNRSLHVDPHRHSHQTRPTDEFPPLVVT